MKGEIHPVVYDTALKITMTWMTENLHQHKLMLQIYSPMI